MDKVVYLYTGRDSYDKRQSMKCSMTIGELIDTLENYDRDAKIIFSNDGGYTYGYIDEDRLEDDMVETEEEEAERERQEEEEAEREELEETYRGIAKELCKDLGKTDADIEFCKDRLMQYAKENNLDEYDVEDKCTEDSVTMFDYIYA